MFKYTKASINMLVDDCKRYAKIFKYISLITALGLAIYQIVTGFINNNRFVYINVFAASLIVVFIIIDLIFSLFNKKTAQKIATNIYFLSISLTKSVILGLAIYEIAVATKVDGIKIVLTTLMIIMWIVSIFSRIVFEIAKIRSTELLVAIKADVEDIKKPITNVSNAFKIITGQKVEPSSIDTRKEKILNKLRKHIIKRK